MQVVMAAFPQRFRQVLFVDFLNGWVLVRFSQFFALIFCIDGLYSLFTHFIGSKTGLASASNTAAGTGHNFYKMIFSFSCFYTVEKLTRIAQPMGYGGSQLYPFKKGPLFEWLFDGQGRLFYPFKPHNRCDVEVIHRQLPSGDYLVSSSQSSLHYPSSICEYIRRTGGKAQG